MQGTARRPWVEALAAMKLMTVMATGALCAALFLSTLGVAGRCACRAVWGFARAEAALSSAERRGAPSGTQPSGLWGLASGADSTLNPKP
jgi:hypothetical protein